MKKILSIILCITLALGALGIFAYADASRTETFISDVKTSRSISVSITDDSVARVLGSLPASISISDVNGYLVGKDASISATVAGFLKVKVLLVKGQVYAYIPGLFCKANITSIVGEEAIDLSFIDELWAGFDTFTENEKLGYFKYSETRANVNGLDIDTYVPDLKAYVAGECSELFPEGTDLSTKSEAEIIEMLASNAEAAAKIRALMGAKAEFCYKTGTQELVNIIFTFPDEETNELVTTDLNSLLKDEIGFEIKSIGTNVSSSKVAAPVFAFDITGFINSILSRFMK